VDNLGIVVDNLVTAGGQQSCPNRENPGEQRIQALIHRGRLCTAVTPLPVDN